MSDRRKIVDEQSILDYIEIYGYCDVCGNVPIDVITWDYEDDRKSSAYMKCECTKCKMKIGEYIEFGVG